jgi:hypothetical protein
LLNSNVTSTGQGQAVYAAMLVVERMPGRHAMAGTPYQPLIPKDSGNLADQILRVPHTADEHWRPIV